MSIITSPLPDCVKIRDKCYKVQTDFRAWIKFYESAENDDIVGMLSLYHELPPSLYEAIYRAIEFGNGADLPYKAALRGKKILDWETDAQLIYAAFMSEYGIDLAEARLHWYKFCALLAGLGENCGLSKIMAIRAADLSAVPKERRPQLRRLKKIYACADRRSVRQRDAQLARELEKAYLAN